MRIANRATHWFKFSIQKLSGDLSIPGRCGQGVHRVPLGRIVHVLIVAFNAKDGTVSMIGEPRCRNIRLGKDILSIALMSIFQLNRYSL